MLRMTRGCRATETLPVTPEAITLGLAAVTKTGATLAPHATTRIQRSAFSRCLLCDVLSMNSVRNQLIRKIIRLIKSSKESKYVKISDAG